MRWSFRFHPAIRNDLRRLSRERRDFIFAEALPAIAGNPYRGEPLHGPLKGFWKSRIGEERIAYAIDAKRREVVIFEIGPRGGFYGRLRRRLKK